MAPKRCPRWSDVELDQQVECDYSRVLATLRAMPFAPNEKPHTVGLDVGALTRFRKFHDLFAGRAEELDGGPMASALPKLGRFALRLALVHHCVSLAGAGADPGKEWVSETAMLAGIELSEWFAHEAERVYMMLAESPEAADTRTLAALVARKGGSISPRELMRANDKKYPTAVVAELALQALEAAGYGALADTPPARTGGQPTRRFTLHSPPDAARNRSIGLVPFRADADVANPIDGGKSDAVSQPDDEQPSGCVRRQADTEESSDRDPSTVELGLNLEVATTEPSPRRYGSLQRTAVER